MLNKCIKDTQSSDGTHSTQRVDGKTLDFISVGSMQREYSPLNILKTQGMGVSLSYGHISDFYYNVAPDDVATVELQWLEHLWDHKN